MSNTLVCPGCRSPLRLKDENSVKKLACPRCGRHIPIPAAAGVADASGGDAKRAKSATQPLADDVGADESAPKAKKQSYKPCPRCGAEGARRVKFTWWGSAYGPAMVSHVRCPDCRHQYNGRTGGSNLVAMLLFVSVPVLLIAGIVVFLFFMLHSRGYF